MSPEHLNEKNVEKDKLINDFEKISTFKSLKKVNTYFPMLEKWIMLEDAFEQIPEETKKALSMPLEKYNYFIDEIDKLNLYRIWILTNSSDNISIINQNINQYKLRKQILYRKIISFNTCLKILSSSKWSVEKILNKLNLDFSIDKITFDQYRIDLSHMKDEEYSFKNDLKTNIREGKYVPWIDPLTWKHPYIDFDLSNLKISNDRQNKLNIEVSNIIKDIKSKWKINPMDLINYFDILAKSSNNDREWHLSIKTLMSEIETIKDNIDFSDKWINDKYKNSWTEWFIDKVLKKKWGNIWHFIAFLDENSLILKEWEYWIRIKEYNDYLERSLQLWNSSRIWFSYNIWDVNSWMLSKEVLEDLEKNWRFSAIKLIKEKYLVD